MTVGSPRVRVAFHEAAHAAVACLVGEKVELVSIRPRASFAGVCFYEASPLDIDDVRVGGPIAMLDPELRGWVERQVLVLMAGDIGEELIGHRRTGYPGEFQTRDDDLAEMLLTETTQTGALLRRLDATLYVPDDEKAWDLTETVADPEVLFAYTGFLRAECRSLVHSPRCRRMIEKLADELLESDLVSGDRVAEIFEAAA